MGVPGSHRVKLSISHWPQPQESESLATMETDHLPIAKQPESSLMSPDSQGLGQAGQSGHSMDLL